MNDKIFALFGNPIDHSKSPEIHKLLSHQNNIDYTYKKFNVEKLFLKKELNNFFIKEKGLGANITVPFKEIVVKYCNELTNRALLSESVNVIKNVDNKIIGDNTDGIGLIFDLNRLNFINKESEILVIGAGGAVKGILPELYNNVKKITLINRTFKKTKYIKEFFINKNINSIEIFPIDKLKIKNYDLIINATSSGIYNKIPNISPLLINKNVKCYDLFYNINKLTPFLLWCKNNGSIYNEDGLGMLVSQAAYSFFMWFNKMPNIIDIIEKLKYKK